MNKVDVDLSVDDASMAPAPTKSSSVIQVDPVIQLQVEKERVRVLRKLVWELQAEVLALRAAAAVDGKLPA